MKEEISYRDQNCCLYQAVNMFISAVKLGILTWRFMGIISLKNAFLQVLKINWQNTLLAHALHVFWSNLLPTQTLSLCRELKWQTSFTMSPRPPRVKRHHSTEEASPQVSQAAVISSDISVITAGQGRLDDVVFRQQILQQKQWKKWCHWWILWIWTKLRKDANDVHTLKETDITAAEDLIKLLGPVKSATTIIVWGRSVHCVYHCTT